MANNMVWRGVSLVGLAGLVASLAACGNKSVRRNYDPPTHGAMLEVLRGLQGRAQSFRAETVMDYWVGDARQKGTVKIMAKRGKKMRVNALNPAGDSPAMDFACDGTNFQMVDFIKDCQLTGPCDATSVEQFFRIRMEPDDFIDVATGGAPVLGDVANPSEVSTWDGKLGAERLPLVSPMHQQTVWLGGRAHGWVVHRTDVSDGAGKLIWKLENKGFSTLTAGEQAFYVPGKSRFISQEADSDLIIEWQSRVINLEISDEKFTFTIPEGLPQCGPSPAK